MARGEVERAVNFRGERMDHEISAMRLSLLLRAVDQDEFKRLYPTTATAILSRHFDISDHDTAGLIAYWCLGPRPIQPTRQTPVQIDHLAERLWEILKPRVEAMIDHRLSSREPE